MQNYTMQLRHKFFAHPTTTDNIRFASKKEADYYGILKVQKAAGGVLFFLRQVPLHLPGNVRFVIDFVTFNNDGTVHFIDVKGYRTESYKAKKRMVENLYPIIVEER